MTNKDKVKAEKTIRFIEELTWLMKSVKINDLIDGVSVLYQTELTKKVDSPDVILEIQEEYKSNIAEKDALIGILPSFLLDKELLEKNLDLAEFAESVLRIKITRPEKRSRYEIIGMIVSDVVSFEEERVVELINTIRELSTSKVRSRIINMKAIKNKFRWNDALQNILND